MRYINNRNLRRFANLNDIQAANREIAQLATPEERSAFIDNRDNQARWSALRDSLWTAGCAKCWYSEAVLQQQEGHVEHFRPKKRLHGAQHSGYWWRAFDWTNFRLAHPTVNRRVTDYLTGNKAGKGSYFPLFDEAQRATNKSEERNEEPVLIDPTIPSDCKLICFDSENGTPVPRYSETVDPVRHKRAKDSIDYFHLDEGTWNFKRKDLMDDVSRLCDKILVSPHDDLSAIDVLIDELFGYLDPFAEFSTAALQVVREKGLLEHMAPIPA